MKPAAQRSMAWRRIWAGLALVAGVAFTAGAQESTPSPLNSVTDDQVNEVAARMYCPVCEMVPLDTCGEPTCIQWRQTIREQLAAGRTPDEIIADFVALYGDRVVGIPQDNWLRLLSLFTPAALTISALGVGIITFMRWRRGSSDAPSADLALPGQNGPEDDFVRRLENDLQDDYGS